MSVLETSFSKDESACGPSLLKTVFTTDILIDQDYKFQNSYFKEHCESWYCFTKSILFNWSCLRACYEIRL